MPAGANAGGPIERLSWITLLARSDGTHGAASPARHAFTSAVPLKGRVAALKSGVTVIVLANQAPLNCGKRSVELEACIQKHDGPAIEEDGWPVSTECF